MQTRKGKRVIDVQGKFRLVKDIDCWGDSTDERKNLMYNAMANLQVLASGEYKSDLVDAFSCMELLWKLFGVSQKQIDNLWDELVADGAIIRTKDHVRSTPALLQRVLERMEG